MKTIMITLAGDIPETEMSKQATVTIEGRTYTGSVRAIITHEVATVETSEVTLALTLPKTKYIFGTNYVLVLTCHGNRRITLVVT